MIWPCNMSGSNQKGSKAWRLEQPFGLFLSSPHGEAKPFSHHCEEAQIQAMVAVKITTLFRRRHVKIALLNRNGAFLLSKGGRRSAVVAGRFGQPAFRGRGRLFSARLGVQVWRQCNPGYLGRRRSCRPIRHHHGPSSTRLRNRQGRR